MRGSTTLSAALLTAMMAAACATGTPITSPIKGGAVDTGAGSLESVRRQLQGTWTLVSLKSSPAPGGALAALKAEGTLIYDDYGNLTIDAFTSDPAAPAAARSASLLAFKGRAVIDTAKSELKLMDLTGNVDPNEVLSPERRRRYAIRGRHAHALLD